MSKISSGDERINMTTTRMNCFSLFEMDDVIRKAGAQRVDEKASMKLREKLEDTGLEVIMRAKVLARHAGRREITKSDILLAARQIINVVA